METVVGERLALEAFGDGCSIVLVSITSFRKGTAGTALVELVN